MDNSDIILFAQQFICNYLQKQTSDKINGFEWGRTDEDTDRGLYRLKVYSCDKFFNLLFSREELTDDSGNQSWQEKLIKKIDEFLNEVMN